MRWETETIKAIGDRINVPFCPHSVPNLGTEFGDRIGTNDFFDFLGTHLFQ